MSKASIEQENRSHRRVGVNLRAAVVLGEDEAYIAVTVDMSEGGVLLENYTGPMLRPGRLVGLNLQGVVSDDESAHSDQFLMRVARCEGERLALRFATPRPMR